MRNTHWRILIVDDDENDRFFLQRALKQFNSSVQVTEAADGQEAIDYLDGKGKFSDRRQFPFPTFLFVDLQMARLDGFTVLQHVKRNPKWAVIPTIVFSASSDLDDVKKAFICGASAFHVKPADKATREKLCRKLIDYWSSSEVPQADEYGNQLRTESAGKLGERIMQP